jgi:hypothetical protein
MEMPKGAGRRSDMVGSLHRTLPKVCPACPESIDIVAVLYGKAGKRCILWKSGSSLREVVTSRRAEGRP